MATVTVSSKGQIVIPLDLRKELGLEEGERLEVAARAGQLVLKRAEKRPARRDWRSWGGSIPGSRALEEHLDEHRKEAKR